MLHRKQFSLHRSSDVMCRLSLLDIGEDVDRQGVRRSIDVRLDAAITATRHWRLSDHVATLLGNRAVTGSLELQGFMN